MAAINNLLGRYYYPDNTNLPIILILHGWDGGLEGITDATMKRIGDHGAFICNIAMRGRNGANGAMDASGREIYDIYDALQYVITNHAAVVDATRVAVWGYSGGGGNVLAALCKFPDTFTVGVDFFGISDYGRDATDGWYQQDGSLTIGDRVGGTPVEVPNNYYARDATVAITNFTGGHLYMYHDTTDITVLPVHSTRIKGAFDTALMTNYTLTSPENLGHGYPDGVPARIAPEEALVTALAGSTPWTIAAAATITVIGYIKTKRFTIWLNTNGTAIKGIDAVATVAYNIATDAYTVTPLTTGGIDVAITQGVKTGTATNITEATIITVT